MRKAVLFTVSAALHAAVLSLALTWPSPMPEVKVIREIRDVIPLPPLAFINRNHADSAVANNSLVFNPRIEETPAGESQSPVHRSEPESVGEPVRSTSGSGVIPDLSGDNGNRVPEIVTTSLPPETNLRSHLWKAYTGSLAAQAGDTDQPGDMAAGLDFQTGLNTPGLGAWSKLVVARIARNWLQLAPGPLESGITFKVPIVVEKSGRITVILPEKGGHSGETSAAVERAIRSASPLPRLPEDYPGEQLLAVLIFSNP